MKKKTLVYIILALAFILLAGCGKKDDDTAEAKENNKKQESQKKPEKKTITTEREGASDTKAEDEPFAVSDKILPEFDLIEEISYVNTYEDSYVVGMISRTYIYLNDKTKDEYPELSKALDKFNKATKKDYASTLPDFTVNAQGYDDMMNDSFEDYYMADCRDIFDISVLRADQNFTSFVVKSDNYWGGAEAYNLYDCYNFNSETGEEIELSDVVKDTDSFVEAFKSSFKNKYGKDVDYDNIEYLNWCLTPVGVNVYFNSDAKKYGDEEGKYVSVGFDEYPDALNGKYKSSGDDYVVPFEEGEIFSVDIDNDGKADEISFDTHFPDGAELSDEREKYTITVNGKEYDDFQDTWFFAWQPYYVHNADGNYIFAYLEGYEDIHMEMIRFDGTTPKFEKTVNSSKLYDEMLPSDDEISKYRSTAFTNSQILLDFDFSDLALGAFLYTNETKGDDYDEMGDRIFEISEVDDKYYIEFVGDSDFAAGEIELLNEKPKKQDNDYVFNIKIHCFSGFSFGGDYISEGYECDLIVRDNSSVILTDGQPFIRKGELSLIPFYGDSIHSNLFYYSEYNSEHPDVIGSWRYEGTTENNEAFENYIELREDGTAACVSKVDSYPVSVNFGIYTIDSGDGMNQEYVHFSGEVMGYAGQPSDDLCFKYNKNRDTLITVADDYSYSDDSYEYYRTVPGEHKVEIAPGPTSRTEQLKKDWKDYFGY